MIDLNYLKMINDTYGHENGNIALKNLSNLVCDVFKKADRAMYDRKTFMKANRSM